MVLAFGEKERYLALRMTGYSGVELATQELEAAVPFIYCDSGPSIFSLGQKPPDQLQPTSAYTSPSAKFAARRLAGASRNQTIGAERGVPGRSAASAVIAPVLTLRVGAADWLAGANVRLELEV